jgi:hypothetical protein
MALDLLLNYGYGLLVDGAEKKEREKIDRTLANLDAPSAERMVPVEKTDGTTVMVSEQRLAELQANASNIRHMRAR